MGSTYFLRPDCLRILFNVPGAKSSLGLPGTVTRPGLVRCLNWRWLPRLATKYHPSSASNRNMSDTFTTKLTTLERTMPNAEVERAACPRSQARRAHTVFALAELALYLSTVRSNVS